MDLTRGTPRALRLRRLPARAAGGVRGRAGRSRRDGGDAHGVRQVALLPAAGAAARRPHGGGLAARGADAGPGRGAGRARAGRPGGARERPAGRRGQRGHAAARRGRGAEAAVRGAGALRRGGLPRPHARGRRGPVRGRRGALRVAVGPRLPAGLLPARGRGADARRGRHRGVHGHRHPAGGRRRRRAGWRCATRCGWPPASTARTSASPWRGRVATRSAAMVAEALRGRRRAAGDRLRRHARGLGGARERAQRRARRGGGGVPRRASIASAAPRCSGASSPTTCA